MTTTTTTTWWTTTQRRRQRCGRRCAGREDAAFVAAEETAGESLTIQVLEFAREMVRSSWAAHGALEPLVYYIVRVVVEARRALEEVGFMLGKTGGGVGSSWLTAAKRAGVLEESDERYVDDDFTKGDDTDDVDPFGVGGGAAPAAPAAEEEDEEGKEKGSGSRRRRKRGRYRSDMATIMADADELLFSAEYREMRSDMRQQEAKLRLVLGRCLALLQALATSGTRRQVGNIVRFGRFFPTDDVQKEGSLLSAVAAQEAAEAAEREAAEKEKKGRVKGVLRSLGLMAKKPKTPTKALAAEAKSVKIQEYGRKGGFLENLMDRRIREVERRQARRRAQVNLLCDQLGEHAGHLELRRAAGRDPRARLGPAARGLRRRQPGRGRVPRGHGARVTFRRRRGRQRGYDFNLLVDETVAREQRARLGHDPGRAVAERHHVRAGRFWRLLSNLSPQSDPEALVEPWPPKMRSASAAAAAGATSTTMRTRTIRRVRGRGEQERLWSAVYAASTPTATVACPCGAARGPARRLREGREARRAALQRPAAAAHTRWRRRGGARAGVLPAKPSTAAGAAPAAQ